MVGNRSLVILIAMVSLAGCLNNITFDTAKLGGLNKNPEKFLNKTIIKREVGGTASYFNGVRILHNYVFAAGNGFNSGLVYGNKLVYNLYGNDCAPNVCVGLTPEVADGRALVPVRLVVMADGEGRAKLIGNNGFWLLANQSFSHPIGAKYRIRLVLKYPNIILNSTDSFMGGEYTLTIMHIGYVNGTPVIEING